MNIGKHEIEVLGFTEQHYGVGMNFVAVINFNGDLFTVTLQGMINIWAFAKRSELTTTEASEFDIYMHAQFQKEHKK